MQGFAAHVQVVLGVSLFVPGLSGGMCAGMWRWEGREVAVAPGPHLRGWWRSSFWVTNCTVLFVFFSRVRCALCCSSHPVPVRQCLCWSLAQMPSASPEEKSGCKTLASEILGRVLRGSQRNSGKELVLGASRSHQLRKKPPRSERFRGQQRFFRVNSLVSGSAVEFTSSLKTLQ